MATTFAPPTLRELAALWVSKGGANLGIVGDAAHRERAVSYHLGRFDLRDGAYSAITERDVRGLSNAASAIDLGRLNGAYANLRAFSVWLVDQGRANAPGTRDIREVIYTPDGRTVLRWDRERGFASAPRPNEADASHLWHTHISYYRDSEFEPKTAVFERFWVPPDSSTEIDMGLPLSGPTGFGTLRIPAGAKGIRVHDRVDVTVTQDAVRTAARKQLLAPLAGTGYDVTIAGASTFIRREEPGLVFEPDLDPVDPNPALEAAIAALEDRLEAIATIAAGGTP